MKYGINHIVICCVQLCCDHFHVRRVLGKAYFARYSSAIHSHILQISHSVLSHGFSSSSLSQQSRHSETASGILTRRHSQKLHFQHSMHSSFMSIITLSQGFISLMVIMFLIKWFLYTFKVSYPSLSFPYLVNLLYRSVPLIVLCKVLSKSIVSNLHN